MPTSVAWLSLDEADSDVNRFLAYVLLALEGAGVDLAGLSQRARAQALDANPERTVAAMLQALDKCGKRIMLTRLHQLVRAFAAFAPVRARKSLR